VTAAAMTKTTLCLLVLYSSCLMPSYGIAQSELQVQSFAERETERVFLSALSVLPATEIPPEWADRVESLDTRGCATAILAQARLRSDAFTPQQQSLLKRLFVRPELPLSYISADGRFKIHYTTGGADAVPSQDGNANSVPDFVEDVAAAFERSYDLQTNDLRYRQPPSDMGQDGNEYDVYIENLGTQFYGFTQAENEVTSTPNSDLTTYIVIDNDFQNGHFTRGVNGALVTAAHEFFHAIQFGYRTLATGEEAFYYELCSVWMEDIVYDAINDYLQYLPAFFSRRDVPFNRSVSSNFGEALWYHFLVKKYDDRTIILRTWQLMETDELAIDAVDLALQEKGSSLAQEFAEFAIWNYFTGSRADVLNYYEEGNLYPEIAIRDTFRLAGTISISDSSRALTHRYFRFSIPVAGEYSVIGQVEEPANWLYVAKTITGNVVGRTHIFQPVVGQNLGFLPAGTDLIVVAANVKVVDGDALPQLNVHRLSFTLTARPGSLERPADADVITAYPNPFVVGGTQAITFVFNVEETADDMAIRILSADGRVVKRSDPAGRVAVYSWNGRDEDGRAVSSGIYMLQLLYGDKTHYQKFALIRE